MDEDRQHSALRRKDTPRPSAASDEKRFRSAANLDNSSDSLFNKSSDDDESSTLLPLTIPPSNYKSLLADKFTEARGEELANAPTIALNGITDECAESLKRILGVKTVSDLAQCGPLKSAAVIERIARRHSYEDAGLFDESAPIASRIGAALKESVCGTDERLRVDTTAEPFDSICFMTLELSNGSHARGTGFYVELGTSRGVLLTAAHCLYDTRKNEYIKEVRIARGRSGEEMPFGMQTFESSAFRVPEDWKTSAAQYADYGIVLLDGPNPTAGFKLYAAEDEELEKAGITTAGYPADKNGFYMWMDRGPVSSVNSGKIFYNEDTFGGQSGSPVWLQSPAVGLACVGVHSYGGCPNSATRLTKHVIDQIKKWAAEN